MSISVSCHCKKQKKSIPCAQSTDSFSCGAKCGKLLNCGLHKCKLSCHSGECSDCTVQTTSKPKHCFCTKSIKTFICPAKPVDFHCELPCSRILDCGKHDCQVICHSNCSSVCAKRNATHCYCGKAELQESERKSLLEDCEFPRSCMQKCGKLMKCGHKCQQICHESECDEEKCEEMVQKACRCGKTSQLAACNAQVLCANRCEKLNSCGKHACLSRCCDKLEHLECPIRCNRKLACGVHFCTEKCHGNSTKCPPCSFVSFDELTCHCGNTRIFPPVQCSQTLGECEERCARGEEAGKCVEHFSRFPHACHPDAQCPSCHALVQVACFCGQTMLSMECWQSKAGIVKSCGKACPFELCSLPCHSGEHFHYLERESSNSVSEEEVSISNDSISLPIPRRIVEFMGKNEWFSLKAHKTLCEFIGNHQKRALFLPPMNWDKRHFICFLSEAFALQPEEVDKKPVKSVIVWKCHGPSRLIPSLATAIRYEIIEESEEESTIETSLERTNSLMIVVLRFTEPHEEHEKFEEFAFKNQAQECTWKEEDQKLVLSFAKSLSISQMKRLKKLCSSTFGCVLNVL